MRIPGAEELVRRIRDGRIGQHGAGIDEADLSELEQGLGVSLPNGYREFLRQLGWLSTSAVEVFGAGPDVPPELDLRAQTVQARNEGVPGNLLPVARAPDGGIQFLDTKHEGPYESPIYRSVGNEPAATEYGAHDFASLLWPLLDTPREGSTGGQG